MFAPVSSKVEFPRMEEEVLRFWKEQGIFQKSLERPDAPLYVFYEGPPTANAAPGVHHAIPRAFKDVILRFWSMRGYRVPRGAGWDTHGLPVELEVEKELGITNKSQIEEYGIARFNQLCRESVMRYVQDHVALTERIAFWQDLDHAYITFTNDYIESCWWALKQLWDRGLIYQGYKVTPHCPRCGTSLSDHEVAQGYKDDAEDPSVWIRFRLTQESRAAIARLDALREERLAEGELPIAFLAWTTTPWTLPGNVALAVAPEAEYAVVEAEGERLILAANLVEKALRGPYRVCGYLTGAQLRGLTYEPLYSPLPLERPAHRAISADWVSLDEGTGIVHIAPAFGAVDLEVGRTKELPLLHTIDLRGIVMEGLPGVGLFAKDADPIITQDLERRGLLYRSERLVHTYPFCWRCDTPLLYYAKTSWYIRTTAVKERLIEGNLQIHWYPEHIQRGRFGNWLENNVDWALSRERYWGTPLPFWRCEGCGAHRCIGSLAELRAQEELVLPAGDLDLHRPYVDGITFRCSECGATMRRIPEIADVWFDSGAMPFAQFHHPFDKLRAGPFEAQGEFERNFPADFICEAVDQTRGWFYTLHALSTLLFDQPCYRNVICLGHILDAKGEKMSKSKGNVVSPWSVIDVHGSDALRWYLFTASPAGNPRRFSTELVGDSVRRYLLTLWNSYTFFVTYARLQGFHPRQVPEPGSRSDLDRWILARLQQTVAEMTREMEAYNPTDAGRTLQAFVEELSTWYVRRSRRRFWRNEDERDQQAAFHTLYQVLVTVSHLTAPFTPFMAEELYRNLVRSVDPVAPESVHLGAWPQVDQGRLDEELVSAMRLVQWVVSLARAARSKAQIKVRQPLARLLVKARTEAEQAILERLSPLLLEELNIKELVFLADAAEVLEEEVRPQMSLLGPKYGPQARAVAAALAEADPGAVARLVREGREVALGGFRLRPEEVAVSAASKPGLSTVTEVGLVVAVTTEVTPELAEEGLARELVHRLQNLRRDAGMELTDQVTVYYQADEAIARVMERLSDYVRTETLARELRAEVPPADAFQERARLDGHEVLLGVGRV